MAGERRRTGRIEPVPKLWLSSREARAYLDCSDDFLQSLRDEAQISFSKVRNKYYYEVKSIERLILKNKVI